MVKHTKKIIAIGTVLLIGLCIFIGWYNDAGSVHYGAPSTVYSVMQEENRYTSGYDLDGDSYIPNDSDPQLGFLFAPRQIRTVIVHFSQPLQQSTLVQLYYAQAGEPLSESHSIAKTKEAGTEEICFLLPPAEYAHICVSINGVFVLGDIAVSEAEPAVYRNFAKLLAWWIAAAGVLLAVWMLFRCMKSRSIEPLATLCQNTGRILPKLTRTEWLYLITCFGIYTLWAVIFTNELYGPDEPMRYDVPEFIVRYGALPYGWEASIRNPYWGFSYGFSTALPYWTSALFIWLASFFTESPELLLIAARMTSVLSMTGVGYYAIQTTKKVGMGVYRWIFIVLLTLTPQSIFLGSYLNLDSFSLCTAMMILYAWVCCLQSSWDRNGCIRLAISIGLCFLSYQFAYSFILGSFLLYCVWHIAHFKQVDWNRFFRYGWMIFGIVFVICGWVFIRNAILYDGDIFAFKTPGYYGELYAIDELKPSLRDTFRQRGVSVMEMLRTTPWLKCTMKSTVSGLGYLTVWAANWVYDVYFWLVCAGSIFVLRRMIKKRVGGQEWYLIGTLLFCAAVTFGISVFLSWSSDYQAQGRYIIVSLIPLWWIVSRGLEEAGNALSQRIHLPQHSFSRVLMCLICGLIALTSVEAFIHCWRVFVC